MELTRKLQSSRIVASRPAMIMASARDPFFRGRNRCDKFSKFRRDCSPGIRACQRAVQGAWILREPMQRQKAIRRGWAGKEKSIKNYQKGIFLRELQRLRCLSSLKNI